jgi:hypothetical protein
MAKRSNKEKKPAKQLDFPPAPAPPPTTKVLPMRLQIGGRFSTNPESEKSWAVRIHLLAAKWFTRESWECEALGRNPY